MSGGRLPRPGAAGRGALGSAVLAAAGVLALTGAAGPAAERGRERPAPAAVHPDGPLPGFTGGFGEPDCTGCHEPGGRAGAAGIVELVGVPERYRPGTAYPLTVRIVRSGPQTGGFQLAARRAGDGAAAGTLVAPGAGVEIDRAGDPPVLYARQTLEGSRAQGDTLSWELVWRAPEEGCDPVVFHLAVNVADGDGTEYGDVIERIERRSSPSG